ncbi:PTS sugar transporter subunit IIA [Carnobacteriaceae bacterium 52-44]
MYGIMIVSHGMYAKGIVEASEMIVGNYGAEYSGLFPGSDLDYFEKEIRRKIENLKEKYGDVIIFTDMMGGTPFNVVCSLMEECDVLHFTGVNLPVLLEVVMARKSKNLEEIQIIIEKNKCKSIMCVNTLKI